MANLFALAAALLLCGSTLFAADAPGRRLNPLEAQFAQIEANAPGFAGWYFDKDGNAVVRVTENGRKAEALERVGRILDARVQSGRGRAAAQKGRRQLTVQPARYSFSELARFRGIISSNLPEGAHSIDLDEVNNTVTVGVADEHAVQRFRGVAARLGLPAAALRVEVTPKPQARTTLRDYQRPVAGGVQTNFTGNYSCTVGINARWDADTNYAGFITASHCSTAPFAGASTTFYQPTVSTMYDIANEWDNPLPSTTLGGCASGRSCRWSDTLFAIYFSTERSSANALNTIAETSWWSYGSAGSITETNDYLTITGEVPSTPTNEWLDKIGRTTGWTYGTVQSTCVDLWSGHYDSSSRQIWLLCNEVTDIYSEPGDSGSPIFKWLNEDEVEWAGILWGGPYGDWDTTYHASNWNVQADLVGYDFYY
ncbi:MAG TPA: hypothetical protein VGF48_06580 [Thermoanaerobaculia bacterium]